MTLYAVGDVQGCLRAFDALLAAVAFEQGRDHLWIVGDLVNRGSDSLGVLRRVREMDASVTCVLGNHDLHLLATAAGARQPGERDTLDDVLAAPDCTELLDWLRRRPLLHYAADARRVLVHAGLPPTWTLTHALERAHEVEERLRDPGWHTVLASMYGDEPRAWDGGLDEPARLRYTINALTRMRYCDAHGALDFEQAGPPGTQPAHLMPWFDFPARPTRDVHVVCGHWSALGLVLRADVTALDSGCVWGGSLTAIALDPPGEPISVPCAGLPGIQTAG